MKKFKCTEEGIWKEVTISTSEENDVISEKILLPASSEDTEKLQEIYLKNKPKLSENVNYKLISASINLENNSYSGKIVARINGNYTYINIK
jgi:hypothetical protein